MSELSSRNKIKHYYHINSNKVESGIGYDMIIGCDLMVQLGVTDDFKRQVLLWDGNTVHMKEPSSLLGKSYLTKCKIHEVVMQTSEPAST